MHYVHVHQKNSSISCEVDGKRLMYTLSSVINHAQLYRDCGHYTAFLKSPKNAAYWAYADDTKVYG